MIYNFNTFSKFHFIMFFYCFILFYVFVKLPDFFSKKALKVFTIFLGFAILFLKIFDSINLYLNENFTIYMILPLHLCNIALIAGALYLLSKNEYLFNLLYFYSFGAIFAIIFPDFDVYHSKFYPIVYFTTHTFEYVIVIYSIKFLDSKISKKGYDFVLKFTSIIIIVNIFVNHFYGTNFMFIRYYAAPFLSVIKPIWLYRIIAIFTYFLVFNLMFLYSKFIKEDNTL